MLILLVATFFVILGALVKNGKMYFLIAGYNTMSAEEKAKYDIEGIAKVFRNGFFAMAILMIAISKIPFGLDPNNLEFISIMVSTFAGVAYILIKVNSKKYRVGNKE